MKLIDAYKVAAQLHAGQVDKAGRPYIEHLTRVMLRVQDAGGGHLAQLVALFHDALEDTNVSIPELREAGLPRSVIACVLSLTRGFDESYLEYVDRQLPRNPDLLGFGPDLVKRCDIEDNIDPDRLALLPDDVRLRLVAKYTEALALLDN
jgi:hypothetical protein